MKIQSTEIEIELNQTTKRLDELTEMRMRLNNNLETLQQGFIGGKTPLEELQAEQGKLTILNESIKGLEVKQAELHTAFQKASLSESNQNLLESATTAAHEAETIFNESLEIRNELDTAIGEIAGRFYDKLSSLNDKRREYRGIRSQIPADAKTPELSDDLLRLLNRNQMGFPPAVFGPALEAAYEQIRREREREELAASRKMTA